jgi:hypothetical protein
MSAMKKSNVISGASGHQVSLSSDERLAGSKRGQPPSSAPSSALPPRRKQPVSLGQLKNSLLEPISEQTGVAKGPDLEARIKQLAQANEHLRAELEILTKSSGGRG